MIPYMQVRGQNPNGQNPNGQNPNGQNHNHWFILIYTCMHGSVPWFMYTYILSPCRAAWCTLHYYAILVYFASHWNTNSNKTNTCKTVLTAVICAQQCNSSLHSPSDHCHPGSTFSHLVQCALSLGATHTLLILMLLLFPLNLDCSYYR